MTDREMLELAARAAGLKEFTEINGRFAVRTRFTGMQDWSPWNPLTDDGDALRLAVRLNIPVIPYDDETSTGTVGVVANNWGSKEANTRRAITRVAAEIGRQMEGTT